LLFTVYIGLLFFYLHIFHYLFLSIFKIFLSSYLPPIHCPTSRSKPSRSATHANAESYYSRWIDRASQYNWQIVPSTNSVAATTPLTRKQATCKKSGTRRSSNDDEGTRLEYPIWPCPISQIQGSPCFRPSSPHSLFRGMCFVEQGRPCDEGWCV